MSIQTVRIAPVERWCAWYAKHLPVHPQVAQIVGEPIQILTTTMRPAMCEPDTRMWDATLESWEHLFRIAEAPIEQLQNPNRGICEHMLELD